MDDDSRRSWLAIAEFEREPIRARTGDGIRRAKAAGVHVGRPPKLTKHQQREVLAPRAIVSAYDDRGASKLGRGDLSEAARVMWLHELWNGTDEQFKRQVKRAQECRELQDKLVGAPLTRWAIRPAQEGDRADLSLVQFCNTSTDGDR